MDESRWSNLYLFSDRPGRLDRGSLSSPETQKILDTIKILVLGAGGLGCEVLKDLALSGFRDIHVIDMDTIDVSNLNRQFLFQLSDVGKNKSDVAAAFINNRVKNTHVTSYNGDITKQTDAFYKQFGIIIGGLDAVPPRSWINQTLRRFALESDEIVIPYIDGGSTGLGGQARLIIPGSKSCYSCADQFLVETGEVPFCTLANKPRSPEHCIEYCVIKYTEKEGRKPDGDNPADVHEIFVASEQRANEYNIAGLTERLTYNVIKHTIPAVASTNSIIAAACANEALKLVLRLPLLDNYFDYAGLAGTSTSTRDLEVDPNCPVCGCLRLVYKLKKETTVEALILLLKTDENLKKEKHPMHVFLANPLLRGRDDKVFYNPGIEETHDVLPRPLSDFIQTGGGFVGADQTLLVPFELTILFEDSV